VKTDRTRADLTTINGPWPAARPFDRKAITPFRTLDGGRTRVAAGKETRPPASERRAR